MRQAATPWAPPTAEQIGLIGTHWSKGWIIENNRISHSICSGIALGKYGDEWDNQSHNSATGYVDTIDRALKTGWSKENIGSHLVRGNTISHCEQAGIVGSLGESSARLPATPFTKFMPEGCSPARRWPESNCTQQSMSRSARTSSFKLSRAMARLDGSRHPRHKKSFL